MSDDLNPDTRTLAERFAAHAGVTAPDGMVLGWRTVRLDFRSRNGYRWPWPGGWATDPRPGVDLNPDTAPDKPCPSDRLGGVCVAVTASGAASGGIPMSTVLVTAHYPDDVLGADAHKLRVARVLVLDVVEVSAATRNGVLRGANLRDADLRGANLGGADLGDADLGGADLRGAVADGDTRWPAGFDAAARGVTVRMSDDLTPVVLERQRCPFPSQCGRNIAPPCRGCLGDGTRAVLDSAREVEPPVSDLGDVLWMYALNGGGYVTNWVKPGEDPYDSLPTWVAVQP